MAEVVTTVPDMLVGLPATAAAIGIFFFLMIGSMVLTLAEMKTERLSAKVREWRNSCASATAKVVDIESPEAPSSSKAARRRARGKGRRSKIQRLMEFFIADDRSDVDDDVDSVFQLDNESWLAPPRPPAPTVEHFDIGDLESPHSTRARHDDVFGLPDEYWRAPSAVINSPHNPFE